MPLVKPARFVLQKTQTTLQRFADLEDNSSFVSPTSSSETRQFQDRKVKLNCLGDCGSKLMIFLLNETNLRMFKILPAPRRYDIDNLKGRKEFFEGLKFDVNSSAADVDRPDIVSSDAEDQFSELFIRLIFEIAERARMRCRF